MAWKGHVITTKTYSTVQDEIKDCAGGFAFADVLALFIDDLRNAFTIKEVTFKAIGGMQKINHGFSAAPLFVAVKNFQAAVDDHGNWLPASIGITAVDSSTVTVDASQDTTITLIMMPGLAIK